MKQSPPAVLVKQISQKDSYSFAIEWSDGLSGEYRLSTLQKMCPCAGCIDEETGMRRKSASDVNENVKARRLYNTGRYALRIQFTEGCSSGIYSFDMLHRFASKKNETRVDET